MKKMRQKNKTSLFLGLGILIFCMLCAPALAAYNYDGYPLDNIKNGTIKGDVYVSSGDKAGFNQNSGGTYYQPHTLITNFTGVPTDGVEWAELKVGVAGANTSRVGWAETKLDDHLLSNETLQANSSVLSENVSCCGTGIYLIHYNCTDLIKDFNINSDGNITAVVNTTPGSPALDCRIYGAVLIVVYQSGDCYTQYWINQGDLNLHKNATVWVNNAYQSYSDFDANFTWFNGTAYNYGNATLTVGYFAGDDTQKDYLYFNVPNDTDTPYNLSNFNWDITSHEFWQFGNNNTANETCDELSGTHTYFDLHTFNVKDRVNHTNNNYAIFWRGHGNDDPLETEIYDPAYPGVNPNTESYISPFLAVLKLSNISTYDFSNYTEGVAGIDHHAYRYQNNSRAPLTNDVPDIEFTDAQYERIKYDDQIFQSDETDTNGNFAAHRFVFNVTDNASVIDAINVTWNGKGWHDAGGTSNGAYLYIWNYNTGSYEELDNCDGDGNENYLIGEKTANLGNYMNNLQVIVLAEQKTADDGDYHSHLETDYVKLLLKPKA